MSEVSKLIQKLTVKDVQIEIRDEEILALKTCLLDCVEALEFYSCECDVYDGKCAKCMALDKHKTLIANVRGEK